MREIDEVLRRRPGLGTLVDEARALRDQLSKERGSNTPGPSALTAAELRLLPMLCTHLSFPEIGAEMFLSRNTIKSEAFSIYRKLGVSSRSQAVAPVAGLARVVAAAPGLATALGYDITAALEEPGSC